MTMRTKITNCLLILCTTILSNTLGYDEEISSYYSYLRGKSDGINVERTINREHQQSVTNLAESSKENNPYQQGNTIQAETPLNIEPLQDPNIIKAEVDGYHFKNIINEKDIPPRIRIDTQQLTDFYNSRKRIEGIENLPPTKISWSDAVIYILTFNSKQPNRLLQAQFDTWIKLVDDEGLDIVVVTDEDDERSYEEVLPDANKVKPRIHLYKSPARKEGTLTRAKTVDTMGYLYDHFPQKKYYLKVDCDTFVIPENLLMHLQKIEDIVSLLPVDFGKANCFTKEQDICYTAGGFYGMNKIAFNAAYHYIQSHPSMYDEIISNFLSDGNNLILHEDFFVSYAFKKATGYPAIKVMEMGEKIYGRHQIGVHKAKPSQKYYHFYDVFYLDGKLRDEILES